MQHTCQDCDHKFFDAGQSQDSVSPAVQCPRCHSYRTQPGGIPAEANDMVHGIGAMPDSTQDDMSGNPLKEGILADGGWKNHQVRDESFAASTKRSDFPSLFETPEFETTQIVAPPDLYAHGMETEATHRANVQIPKGITDNLHATLGNLQAWVENPYENSQLRPYYNKYWKVIRPSFMKPGSLQIGVADPTMAEIINHVAQTDDLTPLYEYRGAESHTKSAGFAIPAVAAEAMAAGGGEALAGGVAGAGAAGALGGPGAAAAGAALADSAGTSASGVGGLMQQLMSPSKVMQGAQFGTGQELAKGVLGPAVNSIDDFLGVGNQGGGGGNGGTPVQDASYYARVASDEDDAYPESHDEVPKNEDGDSKQKDDGNNHEWQRDLSVNDLGGSDHAPSFDPGGAGFERLRLLLPLIEQFLSTGEDASQDPLIQGLHQSLDSEIPGYLDHGVPEHAQHVLMLLSPKGGEGKTAEPEKNEPDHTDENSGGQHHSKVAHLHGDGADFLPDLAVSPPSLRGFIASPVRPSDITNGVIPGALYPEEEMLDSSSWPKSGNETCPYCGHYGKTGLGLCAGCGREIYQQGQGQAQAMQYGSKKTKTADTQGPHAPEQIKAVQEWLLEHGSELGLEGDELIQTILSVPTNPLDFADILAQIQGGESPPDAPPQDSTSANPPMPPQEAAPPGATMPVPGMEQQMMSAVQHYTADSVAGVCPDCGSHTTEILNEDGDSHCHACQTDFKTEGKTPKKVTPTASTWNVDEDLRKEAEAGSGTALMGVDSGSDTEPVQGVPIADQTGQRDLRQEQDSGHTWTDGDGNPLKVGQEYEMYSEKYDIPDLVRIEAVKPHSIVYTLTGEFGLEHSTELTKEEANIERVSFQSTAQDGELGTDDSLEYNDDDHTGYSGEPERTDASAPAGLVSASVVNSGVGHQTNPKLAWLNPHTAGADYTAMEQRALIDERGTARNADLLDLAGTHYIQDAEEDHFLFGV